MTVSIWLYNAISSRNHLRREENDIMVQMLTLPFIFDNKCPAGAYPGIRTYANAAYARTQMRILVHQKGKNETSKNGIKSAA